MFRASILRSVHLIKCSCRIIPKIIKTAFTPTILDAQYERNRVTKTSSFFFVKSCLVSLEKIFITF